MSTCYNIYCEDCKEYFWAGQRSGGSPIARLYGNDESLVAFLIRHEGHHLVWASEHHNVAVQYKEWRAEPKKPNELAAECSTPTT